MKLGCSTLLYGGYDLATAVEHIAAAGYAAVELCSIPGMAEHVGDDLSSAALRDVRARVEDAGLAVESIGASTNLGDPARRARFEALTRAAAALGAHAITTGSGGISGDEASFAAVVRTLRDVARLATESGVTLSIKPHVRQAAFDAATALRLLEEVDSPSVGLNFDASHIVRAGEDPLAALERLREHVATARVRDAVFGVDGPGEVGRQVPGRGDLDIPSLARALAALPRPRYTVLEIVGARELPLESVDDLVARSYAGLAPYFG